MISAKRVYEDPEKNDGFRVLIDRLWPRGMTRNKAKIDLWLKEIGPSNELRKWFGHDAEKWHDFRRKYKQELVKKKELVDEIGDLNLKYGKVTLLYGAKDEEHNNARVLLEVLV